MAEAPRNKLPSGYDEDFVNTVEEDFQCLICFLPLKEPVQTKCGHRFCKECLEEHFRRLEVDDQPLRCPADREVLDRDRPDVFPDKATERRILSLVIKCPSKNCTWTGELRNKEVHLASCLFKVVSCTNENCHVTMQRKELKQHVTVTCQWRIIKCEHCSEPHPECHMQDHIGQCRKCPVTCPNSCGLSIPREMIPKHTEDDCPLTVISCPYVEMGCETKVQRRQVETHLQSAVTLHLDLSCVKLHDTEVKLNETQVKLNETQVKLNETQVKLNETQDVTKTLMENFLTIQSNMEKILVDQKKTMTRENGSFLWKINEFSELLKQSKAGKKIEIERVIPYTATYGYKLKVQIYPNGRLSGKNTDHLSVFLVVMEGEYDAILSWPFNKKIKVTLIDQQENKDKRENFTKQVFPENTPTCFTRPEEGENNGSGYFWFISHEELKRRYIVNDTILLEVEIDQSSK